MNEILSETDFSKFYINKIKYQNSLFSAFKSANETTTLRHLRIASKSASFTEFKNKALAITNDYNKKWLKTEYQVAKSKLRTAKNFRIAQANADLYPNIQYLPSVAAEPRPEHKKFYNMVRAITDPIWNTILPPSTWGCQCQWKTTDEKVTGMPSELPLPDPGLGTNTALSGQIFTDSHPYFDVADQMATSIIRQNISVINEAAPEDLTFFYRHKKSNGVVYSFDSLKQEREANIRIGKIHASKGNEVRLFGQDSIDSKVNDSWNEFKYLKAGTVNSIDKAFQKVNGKFILKNSEGDITLELSKGIDKKVVMETIKNRLRRPDFKNSITGIHFIKNGRYDEYIRIKDLL